MFSTTRKVTSLFQNVRRATFSSEVKTNFRDQILKTQNTYSNIPPKILDLVDRKLYLQPKHPLGILSNKLKTFFSNPDTFKSSLQQKHKLAYHIADSLSPITTTHKNFDDLLVPKDHVSRKRSDTYYITEDILLRTHTSCHQKENIEAGRNAFITISDVYRRDEIDATHYPCFHQMEAVRIFTEEELGTTQEDLKTALVVADLKSTLESMLKSFFGDVPFRWVPAYFPFTEPSFELEMYFLDHWVEMLGCGVIHHDLMKNSGRPETEVGWAAGLGVERLAMRLFEIPDVRLFWSNDTRFTGQFEDGKISQFKPFSKYPACTKDVSMWIPNDKNFEENDLFEIIRNVGGDLIENVELVDEYNDKKKQRTSKCYRIHYRSLERTLENKEIDVMQFKIRDDIKTQLSLELR